MDPFECRMRFVKQLRGLTAATSSAQRLCEFVFQNQQHHEDLYECLIDELSETPSLNSKVNILYFIEMLLAESKLQKSSLSQEDSGIIAGESGFHGFDQAIERDLERIVDAAAPESTGTANLNAVQKVVNDLGQRKLIGADAINRAENLIARRTESTLHSVPQLKPEDILKRMEEDRERHKRARENIWAVPMEIPPELLPASPPASNNDNNVVAFDRANPSWPMEMQIMWLSSGELDDHDYENFRIENSKANIRESVLRRDAEITAKITENIP